MTERKTSEYIPCSCSPDDERPCSIENSCHNALLNIECDPYFCPALNKCENQYFHNQKSRSSLQIKQTGTKGWGLFTNESIPARHFLVEYKGEVIDKAEFQQRFKHAIENGWPDMYFLTLGENQFIDSALYGNEARFINHSCDPNVELIKWLVHDNGHEQTRAAFFAIRNIKPGEELSFDYMWKSAKSCLCGSKKCRGYI